MTCAALCRYAAPLYVDLKKTVITRAPNVEPEIEEEHYPKIFIGEVRAQLHCKCGHQKKAA